MNRRQVDRLLKKVREKKAKRPCNMCGGAGWYEDENVDGDLERFPCIACNAELNASINAKVERMVKEDHIVGRWVRLTFPEKFDKMLLRAQSEARLRRKLVRL